MTVSGQMPWFKERKEAVFRFSSIQFVVSVTIVQTCWWSALGSMTEWASMIV